MSVLAIIPARGSSKGIPRKNIRELDGKPLIAWTIEQALQANCIDRIVVSTEDTEIAGIAKDWGADVPFTRPAELAKDDTPGISPIIHALSILPDYDRVLVLQPTSPLRSAADIEGILELAVEQQAPAAVSVSEVRQHPYWTYDRDSANLLTPVIDLPQVQRRQDLPAVYALNGALYLAKREWLLRHGTFLSSETIGYVMPADRSADIDTPLDWAWVEFLLGASCHG